MQIIIRPLQHRTKKTKKRIKCKGRKKVFWFGLFNLNYINKEIGLSFFLSLPILVYLFFLSSLLRWHYDKSRAHRFQGQKVHTHFFDIS